MHECFLTADDARRKFAGVQGHLPSFLADERPSAGIWNQKVAAEDQIMFQENSFGQKKSGQGDFHLTSRTLAAVLVAKAISHKTAAEARLFMRGRTRVLNQAVGGKLTQSDGGIPDIRRWP